MKHYTVQITDKALADMEEIYNYIAEQLPIDNFSIFYVIEDNSVVVTRVLYSASDISRGLLER